jgi:lipoprotein signal peptidase
VIDFIAIKYFAVFNIADIFISTGIILILIYYYARTPK